MPRFLPTLLLLASFWPTCQKAEAQVCYQKSSISYAAATPTYHYQAPYYAPPIYYYTLGSYPQGQMKEMTLLEEIRDLRKSQDTVLKFLEYQTKAARQAQQATEPPHVAVLRQNCASCHTAGNLKQNGFAMFNGAEFNNLTPKQYDNIVTQLEAEAMPPGKKLSQGDSTRIIIGIVQDLSKKKTDEAAQLREKQVLPPPPDQKK